MENPCAGPVRLIGAIGLDDDDDLLIGNTDTDTHTVFISFRFAAKAELHEWGQY